MLQAPVINGVRMEHMCGQFAILSVISQSIGNAQNKAKLQLALALPTAKCTVVLSTCICVHMQLSLFT